MTVHIAHCKNINVSYELCVMSYCQKCMVVGCVNLVFHSTGEKYSQGPLMEINLPTISSVMIHPTGIPTATPFVPLNDWRINLEI